MPDKAPAHGSDSSTRERSKIPVWVIVSVVVAAIAVTAFLVVHLMGGGMAGMHG